MRDASMTEAWRLEPASGARAAPGVLLLHGLTGSPWEVRPLGEALAARGFLVHAPRLPGHGLRPEDLASTHWADWLAEAETAASALRCAATRMAVVGHSMGALLGLILAARQPEAVGAMALVAPAWRLRAPAARLLRALRKTPLPALLPRWVQKSSVDAELDEVRAEAPLLPRFPTAALLDLFQLQDLAAEGLPAVRCPCLVVAAARDHVVSLAGVEALHRRLEGSRLLVLQRGFHLIPRDRDRAEAAAAIGAFLDETLPLTPA